jgi:hypothetical protein
LILGANLTRIDPSLESLLTNREVLAVDQQSTGSHQVVATPETVIWKAHLEGNREALAVFNLTDATATVEYPWNTLGLEHPDYAVRDLWQRKDLGSQKSLRLTLPAHGSALLLVRTSGS